MEDHRFSCLHLFLDISFVCSEIYSWNVAQFTKFNVAKRCENYKMVMQIFLVFDVPPHVTIWGFTYLLSYIYIQRELFTNFNIQWCGQVIDMFAQQFPSFHSHILATIKLAIYAKVWLYISLQTNVTAKKHSSWKDQNISNLVQHSNPNF